MILVKINPNPQKNLPDSHLTSFLNPQHLGATKQAGAGEHPEARWDGEEDEEEVASVINRMPETVLYLRNPKCLGLPNNLTGWEMIRLLMQLNPPPSLYSVPARGREARKRNPSIASRPIWVHTVLSRICRGPGCSGRGTCRWRCSSCRPSGGRGRTGCTRTAACSRRRRR